MSTNGRLLIGVIILVFIAGGVTYARDRYFPRTPAADIDKEQSDIRTEPTDFAEVGFIRFGDASGPGQLTPLFEHQGSTSTLLFDAMSICALGDGAVPCMAMSITYDVPMKDREALVEGNKLQGGSILVRKLRIAREGEGGLIHGPVGDRFISWSHAQTLVANCQVEMAMQTHALDIYLTLKSGERLRTVEPVIDDIFRVVNDATAACGTIGLGTE